MFKLSGIHICGNVTAILPDMKLTGADIIDIDWMVDMKESVESCRGFACVNGNYDPVAVLLQGTPAQVEASVRECLAVADEFTFVSAGCEVPKDTPGGNLLMAAKALAAHGATG